MSPSEIRSRLPRLRRLDPHCASGPVFADHVLAESPRVVGDIDYQIIPGACRKYPDELDKRATQIALEVLDDPGRSRGGIARAAEQLGVQRLPLQTWVRKAHAEGQDAFRCPRTRTPV